MNQHLATPVPRYNQPVPQYQPQPHLSYMPSLGHNSFHRYPPVQPPSYLPNYHQVPQRSYRYRPPLYPMQSYNVRPPLGPAYDDRVRFVDEVAIMQSSDIRLPLGPAYDDRVRFVDEVAIILVASDERSDGYEDLLNLQEQMGRVNVGLPKEMISENLKTSRVDVAIKDKEEGGEICAVCQDEYKHNEMVGTLHCGHRYHENCIKEWLLHKNVCPICKDKALMA